MWIRQIIALLCILYVGTSLAKTFHYNNIGYNYQTQSRRHALNRGRSVTTTPRPLLQQYWHSFVRNLPTLPPIAWNITRPIGNIFNVRAQHIIESPGATHYMTDESDRRKTKATKRKSSRNSQKPKQTHSRNYFQMYANNYPQMQLQPLGLDHNRIMHFYEPSTGQYYALQVESQPYYHNNLYQNNQNNGYNRLHDVHDNGSFENEFDHPEDDHTYDSEDSYELQQEYEAGHGDYDNEYDNGSVEYDDGVELADNWGHTDEETFADRKLKTGPHNSQSIAGSIMESQKHLLKPETEEDKKNAKNKGTEKQAIESLRNSFGTYLRDNTLNRKTQSSNTNKTLRLQEKPNEFAKYYLFPAYAWL